MKGKHFLSKLVLFRKQRSSRGHGGVHKQCRISETLEENNRFDELNASSFYYSLMYLMWDWRHHSRDIFLSCNLRFFRFLSRDWWWTSSDLWAEQDLLLLWLLHFFHLCTFGFEDDWSEEDHATCEEDPRRGADEFVQRADTNDRGIDDGLGEIAHRLRKHFCQAPKAFCKGLIRLILIIIALLLFILKTQLG